MAVPKLLVFWIAFAIAFLGARADGGIEGEIAGAEAAESPLRREVEELRAKISALESSIADRAREIKSKEDSIARLESSIHEKSSSIDYLQSEIESLQNKGDVDADELVRKAQARASELERQVAKLRNEIEAQSRKKDALETRAFEAEKKVQELNLKLQSLQKTNDEQKLRIRKTQRALEMAEEELMKAQLEATSKLEKLSEIHGAWFPPWLATHLTHFQELAVTHWNVHAKPTLAVILQKASEKSARVQKWAEPHFVAAKTEWIPALKEQLEIFKTNAGPFVQKISTKTVEVYETTKSTIAPHIVKVQGLADPYFQEAKKFSKPYIDQVATVTKPHVEKARVVLKPYTKRLVHAYRKFLNRATAHHHQVQAKVQKKLKKHELTKPLATKEFAWIVASASLAFPIFFLQRLLSAIFCKKPRKPRQNDHANQAPRRHKRRHADK